MNIRLIPAPLAIDFSLEDETTEAFEREFQRLSSADDDAIGQWLKLAKAKGETQETDKILLQLLIEMHRKIDNLELLIKHEKPVRLELHAHAMIDAIGFEHFELKEAQLIPEALYYGRMHMPVYPKRDVPIFFKAITATQAQILRIHERDQIEWNGYVTARERVMIRELKQQEQA